MVVRGPFVLVVGGALRPFAPFPETMNFSMGQRSEISLLSLSLAAAGQADKGSVC
uniref:Uncharacterized protein n=1 Tax=mine drainage metagenome TaxID=410659 RepID=E6PYP1_9ZZZZ